VTSTPDLTVPTATGRRKGPPARPAAPPVATGFRIEAVELPVPSRADVARRLGTGLRSATRHLPAAARDRTRPATIRALRRVFEDLGGTFIKFGQLIGSAPSIFGDDVADEFRAFLDAGPAVPFADVASTVESELGCPLADVFADFDREPMAAASLAVVHRATLDDGRQVVVKVLRPGVEHLIATDLAILGPIFTFVARQVAVGIASTLPGVIIGLRDQISEELDLRNEARSMRWFIGLRDAMGLHRVHVPEPHEALSSRRVLVMDFVDGVPVDDAEAIAALGVDAPALIRDTIAAWLSSAMCTGRFHGDVHAGNLLVTPDGRLGVLDWGIVGRLDDASHAFFRRCIEGVLGDESAWPEVAHHLLSAYGDGLQDAMGLTDEQLVPFVRGQVEPLFRLPFGEVDLATMVIGSGEADPVALAHTRREKVARWRAERARVRRVMATEGYHGDFDRATFLLTKQLVYFDRYGKQYIPETPLLFDESVFRSLLDLPPMS
jgi:hypothetical protein